MERELVKMMKYIFVNHDIMGMSVGFNSLCHMSYVFIYIYIYYVICTYIYIYIAILTVLLYVIVIISIHSM